MDTEQKTTEGQENVTAENASSSSEDQSTKEQLDHIDTSVEEGEEQQEPAEGDEQRDYNKLQEEILAAKDKYLRLYSEFENFRRRTSKEKLDMIQSANEQLLISILPVLDDFERAGKTFGEELTEEQKGFQLIQHKFKKIIEQFGVKEMVLRPGDDFDTDLQEAVTQIPAPEESMKGKVVDIVEKGYLLGEKVIRYAKVVVGN